MDKRILKVKVRGMRITRRYGYGQFKVNATYGYGTTYSERASMREIASMIRNTVRLVIFRFNGVSGSVPQALTPVAEFDYGVPCAVRRSGQLANNDYA